MSLPPWTIQLFTFAALTPQLAMQSPLSRSDLRSCRNECLAGLVVGVLLEVLDEAACKILGLDFPLLRSCIGVARIQDCRVDARKLCGHFKVEVRDGLGGCLEHVAVQDRVDDAAGIFDGNTLAGAVPARVHEVSLRAALLHSLDQLLAVLGGVQLEERLAEASGESRSGLCDAALCTCQLSCETGQEVILSLLRCQNRDRRQHTERIRAQEDHVLSCRACRLRVNILDDVLDVLDRVGNTRILGDGLVSEVDLAVLVYGDVLKKGVPDDRVVDVGLGIFVQVDDLSVAAALVVEDAFVVPAVLVIADEQALGICGNCLPYRCWRSSAWKQCPSEADSSSSWRRYPSSSRRRTMC